MKIFKSCDSLYMHRHPKYDNRIFLTGGKAGSFLFESNVIKYEEYLLEEQRFKFYKILGDVYRRMRKGDETYYSNEEGDVLDLPPVFIGAIFPDYPLDRESDVFSAYVENYPKKFKTSLAVLDCNNKTIIDKPVQMGYHLFTGDYLYGFDSKAKEFVKFDKNLEYLWTHKPNFKPTGSMKPIKYKEIIVTFIGPKKESSDLVNGLSKYTFSGGVLIGLNDVDGSVAWEVDIPNAVDEYKLVGDILYVVSLNEILMVNPSSGEIINTIDTETSTPFDRLFAISIYVDESYIYYSHFDDALILIYDIQSLKQAKRIELPEGYYAKEHNFHDKNTGKQYFNLTNLTQYVAQRPILEVDPNKLDSGVEFETEPEHSIKLKPSPENADEKELVIEFKSESLDDALRFGEIYTRDEAQRYSFNYMDMTFDDRPFAPEKSFNGVIRFVYSGCNQSDAVVNEHLRIMEKRFESWNGKEGFFSCTNKDKATKLVAEYIK